MKQKCPKITSRDVKTSRLVSSQFITKRMRQTNPPIWLVENINPIYHRIRVRRVALRVRWINPSKSIFFWKKIKINNQFLKYNIDILNNKKKLKYMMNLTFHVTKKNWMYVFELPSDTLNNIIKKYSTQTYLFFFY